MTTAAEHCAAWRAKNRLRANAMSLDWYRRNKVRILAERRAAYHRDVEAARAAGRRKYKPHPLAMISKTLWYSVLSNTIARAGRKGLPCDLDQAWALARWTGKCEVTGLEFRKGSSRGPSVFSPSIDRCDPAVGYTQANCRFVLFGVNALKGAGSDADMLAVARAINEKNG